MATNILRNAIKNYKIKNYKEAYAAFKKLAKSHTEATYYLGLMYFNGYFVNQDYNQAYTLFNKAYEGLYTKAIYMLGLCYEEGKGVTKDYNKAYEFYETAGKNESTKALLKIAEFSEQGIVVKKSLKSAIEIYVKLTKINNAYAMYKIGSFYLEGKGLRKSLDNAYVWLNKALSAGSIEAMNYFRFLGSKSKNDIRTTEEIYASAKSYLDKNKYEEGMRLLEIAAKENYVQAILDLSDIYFNGIGSKQSPKLGFQTLLKYKDVNDPEIYYKIGECYEEGKGINSSYIKAVIFYELSAKLNYELAKVALKEIRGY